MSGRHKFCLFPTDWKRRVFVAHSMWFLSACRMLRIFGIKIWFRFDHIYMAISLIHPSPKKLFTLGMLSKQNRSIFFPIWPTYIGYKSALMNKGHPLWLAHHNIILLFTLWTFSKERICSPKLQEGSSLQHSLQKWFFICNYVSTIHPPDIL